MRFSIIVPIYNVEAYIRDCIDSVLNQNYSDWELILVDDSSPDNCPRICDEYAQKDSRIKVIHKKNGGPGSARKAGLEIVSGEYVICIDGDDFFCNDCLFKIHQQIDKHQPDVVCHGFVVYGSTMRKQVPLNSFKNGYYDRSKIETEILPNLLYTPKGAFFPRTLWAKAFKTEHYRRHQMVVYSDINMGEDGACVYPLIGNANSMVIMQDCLYYYRQNVTSLTRSRKLLSWDNYDKVYEIYKDNLPLDSYRLKEQFFRSRTHNLFIICASQFYNNNQTYKQITEGISNRFRQHPEYDEALDGAHFTSAIMTMCKYVLKLRLYRILQLYAYMKSKRKRI